MARKLDESITSAIRAMSERYNIPYAHALAMARVESDFNPKVRTGSYKGLYQVDDKQFAQYGPKGGNIYNPADNAMAAGAIMQRNAQEFEKRTGRAPTLTDRYMMHQQGVAGYSSHVRNPDQPAWKSFQQASKWSDHMAKKAIWGNMSPEMKKQFPGGVDTVKSADFTKLWDQRITRAAGEATAIAGVAAPSTSAATAAPKIAEAKPIATEGSVVPTVPLGPGALPAGIIPPPQQAALPGARMAEGGRAGSPLAPTPGVAMSEGGRAEALTPGSRMSEGGRAVPPAPGAVQQWAASTPSPQELGNRFREQFAAGKSNGPSLGEALAGFWEGATGRSLASNAPISRETPPTVPQTQYGPNSQTPAAPITALDQGGPDVPTPAPAISPSPDGGLAARSPIENFSTPSMIGPTDATPNSGLVGGGIPPDPAASASPAMGAKSTSQAADRASDASAAERPKNNPLDFFRPAGSEQWPDWAVRAFNQDVWVPSEQTAAGQPLASGGAASLPSVPKFGDLFEGGFKQKPILGNFLSGMFGG